MAEPKGRKKKRERERRRSGASPAAAQVEVDEAQVRAQVARQVQQATVQQASVQPMPSPTARATGFVLALVTGLLAVVMVYNGVTGDAGGLDLAMRIVAGALLILLAVVVAMLVVSPDTVRRIVWRGRDKGLGTRD